MNKGIIINEYFATLIPAEFKYTFFQGYVDDWLNFMIKFENGYTDIECFKFLEVNISQNGNGKCVIIGEVEKVFNIIRQQKIKMIIR